MVEKIKVLKQTVDIALVGKYTKLHDAYLSVAESLMHGGIANNVKINIIWVDSENLDEKNIDEQLKDVHGIIAPGGFGERGTEGIILAIKYARENNIPYFGICYGMQLAAIEFAKNVLGLNDATTTEFEKPTTNPVIDIMEDQKEVDEKGGTMRLGAYPCKVKKDSNLYKSYNEELINERHRHRYEFNNKYIESFEKAGMKVTGTSPNGKLVEVIELENHPWFVAVQYHPELKSRPNKPHPLFASFVGACVLHS